MFSCDGCGDDIHGGTSHLCEKCTPQTIESLREELAAANTAKDRAERELAARNYIPLFCICTGPDSNAALKTRLEAAALDNQKLRKAVMYLSLYLKHLPICVEETEEAKQLEAGGMKNYPRTAQTVCPVEQVEKLLQELERG